MINIIDEKKIINNINIFFDRHEKIVTSVMVIISIVTFKDEINFKHFKETIYVHGESI